MRESERSGALADAALDELLPAEELDWRDLVRRYPGVTLALAALGGFVLGRRRGPQIVEALANFAADQVARNVNELLGEEVL